MRAASSRDDGDAVSRLIVPVRGKAAYSDLLTFITDGSSSLTLIA